jgi:ribosomal protein L7/L12
MSPTPELPAAAITALHAGNKIEAIKCLREAQRLDLKNAKDRVEAYIASRPELAAAWAAGQAEARRNAVIAVLVLAAIGLLVAWVLRA